MCIYACERNSVFQLRLVKRVVHSSQKEREREREREREKQREHVRETPRHPERDCEHV